MDAQAGARPYRRQLPAAVDRSGILALASWEIDLFGKLRRATEAARADLLASQENQKAVMQALVAEVASAYFDLREYDAELEYVRESIKTRQESVESGQCAPGWRCREHARGRPGEDAGRILLRRTQLYWRGLRSRRRT